MEKGIAAKDICMNLMETKKEFIKSEIWILTIAGAFQRANVYNTAFNERDKQQYGLVEKEKLAFRTALFKYVNPISGKYKVPVSDDVHIKNIEGVQAYSKEYAGILTNGQLNFGVAQKLLNLYLKYLWCLEELPVPPPHFPVDRIIQKAIAWKEHSPWTQMEDEKKYLQIINHARERAAREGFESIAELELEFFARRKTNG